METKSINEEWPNKNIEREIRNNVAMKQYAILVLSSDKYSSLWKPFFLQFHKYWQDCPYPVYLGSNTIGYPNDKRVKTILSGEPKNWSSNLLSILNQVPEKYIFVWLEDYFLIQRINTKLFEKCFIFLESEEANHIHMAPHIQPDGPSNNRLFGYYERRAPYRVSVLGFWKKDHLQRILLPGENPQQFEIFGSYRSSYFDGYYCLKKNLFESVQLVERGKIFREAYDYCSKHGIELDLSDWEIRTRLHKVKSDIFRFIFEKVVLVPWKARLYLMDIFRKALASY